MVDRELNKRNLQSLVDDAGGQRPLCDKINARLAEGEKQIEPSQISSALQGRRPFGEKIKRKIEEALSLGSLWFEREHKPGEVMIVVNGAALSRGAVWIARAIDALPRTHMQAQIAQLRPHLAAWAPGILDSIPETAEVESGEREARIPKRQSNRAARSVSEPDPGGD